jgi:hypothetical protein
MSGALIVPITSSPEKSYQYIRGFGMTLKPREFSAQDFSTSELLRFL